jgi:hypothetical protein
LGTHKQEPASAIVALSEMKNDLMKEIFLTIKKFLPRKANE